MANTKIQILRSYETEIPPDGSLADGEIAYSFVSEGLYIGDQSGNVFLIGGPKLIQNLTADVSTSTLNADGGEF